MDLFIQPELELEKTAGEVDLPEDPNQWPQEVLQELFKQVPYIADFQPHVTMQRVDSERGYGLGQVEIANKTEAQLGTDGDMLAAAGIRSVRVPVVIREYKLSPFDLLVNDAAKVLPLTESRLRQSLFRPQLFDVTSQTPGDQSMIGQLYPPYRQNYGFGGGGVAMSTGMGKQSSVLEEYLVKELESRDPGFRHLPLEVEKEACVLSAKGRSSVAGVQEAKTQLKKASVPFRKTASMISATFSTYNRSDIDRFFETLTADVKLQASYQKNAQALMGPLGTLASHDPTSLEKRASTLISHIKPTVVQLIKQAEGYLMKTASHLYWNPVTVRLNRWELVQNFGEKVALAADEAGQVTLAEGADTEQEGALDEEEPITINEAGLYKVREEEGDKELIGFVIPNLLDVDGTPLPLAMFTNGSHSAVQPDIVGVPAGDGGNLPTGQPGGAGAFFSFTSEGALQATIPLKLAGGSYASPNEPSTLVGSTFDGRPLEVSIQPNIQTIVQSPEGKMLVPQHWQWTPLGAAEAVALASSENGNGEEAPDDWHESAPEAVPEDLESNEPEEQKESHVWLRGDHDCFTFTGPGVDKLASADTQMVGLDEAMFLLAGLGVEQGQGLQKLAHSMRTPQRIKVGRLIKTAASQDAWARAQAQKWAHIAPMLRKDLMKEAALIPDPTAADSVLSLGFINPENIMTFVSYLPTLEDAQTKMCDLLLASRVGLSEVSNSALERAIRSLEETIEGLKVLAFQGQ